MSKAKDEKKPPKLWKNMHDDERQFIIDNLMSSGFGSELKARQIFSEKGFHSWAFYFFDSQGSNSGKWREVDIIAESKDLLEHIAPVGFHYHIIAEVKRGFTWILADVWGDRFFDTTSSTRCHEPDWLMREWDRRPIVADSPDLHTISNAATGEDLEAAFISTSIHQYTKEQDAWYEAAIKVIKATRGFEFPYMGIGDKKHPSVSVHAVVPLVILDGNLLRVVDGSGNLSLEEQDHVQVLLDYRDADLPASRPVIHVVTMDGLGPFLERVRTSEARASEAAKRIYAKTRTDSQQD